MHLNIWGQTIILLLIILGIVLILRIVVDTLIRKVYKRYIAHSVKMRSRMQRRFNTIIEIENNLTISLAIIVAIFILVRNFFNVGPFLAASVGVIGLAIGLSAQSFLKDIITGVFFLLQDQFGIGDVVQVNNNVLGTITDITLRTITLRDFNGNVTTFPNSLVMQITNQSKEWSMFVMPFVVNATAQVDTIMQAMREAGEKLEEDSDLKRYLLDKPIITGVENFSDGKFTVGVNIKTVPGKQFDIGRKYRYYLKKIIEEQNISI